ncbi:hypothetical protein EVAR_48330_1 [Eumeta japonica]|uniref:Uncharacterized protein n=1 Tax=Eumeta variegata TaxID=151549 RepID=A0A4C1YRZ4_EUMVA|nr:hypothetical protein EVAR_48330_1 [Eumeta japonica]
MPTSARDRGHYRGRLRRRLLHYVKWPDDSPASIIYTKKVKEITDINNHHQNIERRSCVNYIRTVVSRTRRRGGALRSCARARVGNRENLLLFALLRSRAALSRAGSSERKTVFQSNNTFLGSRGADPHTSFVFNPTVLNQGINRSSPARGRYCLARIYWQRTMINQIEIAPRGALVRELVRLSAPERLSSGRAACARRRPYVEVE